MARKNYDDFESVVSNGFTMPPSEINAGVPSFGRRAVPTEPDGFNNADYIPTTQDDSQVQVSSPETEIAGRVGSDGKKIQTVVGWVVGISGECRGRDFRLHSGQNQIGRGEDLDITLHDKRISRTPVLEITFDPLSNSYQISRGSGNSLRYVNNKLLIQPRELAPYDRIQLAYEDDGNVEFICELLFVPLCGEHFSWAQKKDDK